jgi:phosphopantetheine adenylyltransferase
MKKFSAFLSEAERSMASKEAQQLRLTHVGYGKYANEQGQVTHMSKDGKLIKLTPQEKNAQQISGVEDEEGGNQETGSEGSIAITFGRFNPPTVGHEKLLDRVSREAQGGDYRIYVSQSEDPQKNPLSPQEKVNWMAKSYPDHADYIISDEQMRTIFDVLKALNEEGYGEVKMIVGGDRVSEFNSLAQKYNGQLYEFENILVQSAGDRDPDGEGLEAMSASKMRQACADDDFKTFEAGTTKNLKQKDKLGMYRAVRSAMKLESFGDFNDASYNLFEIAPKLDPQGLREAYINEEIFKVGAVVENVNTGVLGKVVSRGSNYLIYIDENDSIFRGWLKDLVEVDYSNPSSREFGTDSLTNYVKKLTPGEFVQKINKTKKATLVK